MRFRHFFYCQRLALLKAELRSGLSISRFLTHWCTKSLIYLQHKKTKNVSISSTKTSFNTYTHMRVYSLLLQAHEHYMCSVRCVSYVIIDQSSYHNPPLINYALAFNTSKNATPMWQRIANRGIPHRCVFDKLRTRRFCEKHSCRSK